MLGASAIEELLARHGLSARRSLGQNFVADPNLIDRIVDLAGVRAGDHVVEVGPGLGSLTVALAATGAHVVAVEKDRALLPALQEVLGARGVEVELHAGDATRLAWPEVLDPRHRWKLVANLPYNVAVPVILDVLADAPMVDELLVMVQREVADRLVATPGGRTIGVPTIKVAWHATAAVVATVPAEVFVPRPRVSSALVALRRRPPPADELDPEVVFELVERAYRQRRKMLRATLGDVVDPASFDRAGVSPTARPEELGVEDWAALARSCAALGGAPA